MDRRTLSIGGMPADANRVALKGIFSRYGEVATCYVGRPFIPAEERSPADEAYIKFQSDDSARAAMEAAEAGEEDCGDAPYRKPEFPALSAKQLAGKSEMRRVPVPPHRLTPLKACWMELLQPLVEHMKLQVRMNVKRRCVEIRTSQHTADVGALQKAADFVKAFMLGFSVADAIALLRLDDLFIESFEVKDVKRLQGDHLSRCIGRIAGKDGKTKYAIENATRTRISLAEDRIHILGSFSNIRLARDSICALILGSAPGKVYTRLRDQTHAHHTEHSR